MKHFKWYDANGEKPEQGVRVLLKIKNEESPVVGYWTGEGWEVCKGNIYAEADYNGYAIIKMRFDQNHVAEYMYIDMDS